MSRRAATPPARGIGGTKGTINSRDTLHDRIPSPHMSITIGTPRGPVHTEYSLNSDIPFVVTSEAQGKESRYEVHSLSTGTSEDIPSLPNQSRAMQGRDVDGHRAPTSERDGDDSREEGSEKEEEEGEAERERDPYADIHTAWRQRAPDEYAVAQAPALMVKRLAVRERLPDAMGVGPHLAPDYADVVQNNETIVHDERLVCDHCHYLLDSEEELRIHRVNTHHHHHHHHHHGESGEHARVPSAPKGPRLTGYIPSADAEERKRVWRGSVFNREAHDKLPGLRTVRMQQYYASMHTMQGEQDTGYAVLEGQDEVGRDGEDMLPSRLTSPVQLAQDAGIDLSLSLQENRARYSDRFIARHFEKESRSIHYQAPPSHVSREVEETDRPESPWLFEPDLFLLQGIGRGHRNEHLADSNNAVTSSNTLTPGGGGGGGGTDNASRSLKNLLGLTNTYGSALGHGDHTVSVISVGEGMGEENDYLQMCQFMVLPEPDADELTAMAEESEFDEGSVMLNQDHSASEDSQDDYRLPALGRLTSRPAEVNVVQFPSATWESDKDRPLARGSESTYDDKVRRPAVVGVTIQETDDRRVIVDSQEEENARILREIRALRARNQGPINNTVLFYNNKRRRNYMSDSINADRLGDYEEMTFKYTDLQRRSQALSGRGDGMSETAFRRYEKEMYELDDQLYMKAHTLGGHNFTKYKSSQRGKKGGDMVAANKNTHAVYNPEEGVTRAAVAAAVPTVGHSRGAVAVMDKETQRLLASEHQVIAVRAEAVHRMGAAGAMVQASMKANKTAPGDQIYLFCYGRHMDHQLLQQQVGHRLDPPVFGLLFEYGFKFNKKGLHPDAGSTENVEKSNGASCEGVIYTIHRDDLPTLDDYMAAPSHYQRTYAIAWASRTPEDPILHDTVQVVFYKAAPEWTDRNDVIPPTRAYVRHLLKIGTLLSPSALHRIEVASNIGQYRQRSKAVGGNKAPRTLHFKRRATLLGPAPDKNVTVVTLDFP